MWKILACASMAFACDGKATPAPAADAAVDAAIDAPPDAFRCRFAADCASDELCCYTCSPGGACFHNGCLSVANGACAYSLCDPTAPGPCVKEFNGGPGTCMLTKLGLSTHEVWACR